MMAIISTCIAIILYLLFYLSSHGVSNRFHTVNRFDLPVTIFLLWLGILQMVTYLTNALKIPSSICAVVYIGLFVVIVLYFVRIKWIKLTKADGITILITIIITLLLLYRSSYYSLGSTSDSAFYMSMVNENAFNHHWQPFMYYVGQPLLKMDPLYDYQAFYHLFAYILKFYAQVFSEASYAPVYVWCAQALYLLLFVDTILRIGHWIWEKNRLVAIFGVAFILCWNTTTWHFVYGYFGHSWRTLAITMMILAFGYGLKSKRWIYFVFFSIFSSALIGLMSSGLFVNIFLFVAIWFGLIIRKEHRLLKWSYLAFFPTYCYLIVYFVESVYWTDWIKFTMIIAALVLFAIGYLVLSLLCRMVKPTLLRNTAILMVIVLFSGFFIYGLFGQSTYGFDFFFSPFTNQMSVPYFYFGSLEQIICNVIWIIGAVGFIIKNQQRLKQSTFALVFVVLVVLFINPLVTPFVTQFLTSLVYYRCFELIFNFFFCFALADGLVYCIEKTLKHKLFRQGVLIFTMVGLGFVILTRANDNPFQTDLDEPIDPIYRILTSELEADLALAQIANASAIRINVVSQAPFTKSIVRNINLLYGINTTRSFCTLCNINEAPVHQPSAMHNLFMLRDFADQAIYDEPIDWDNACSIEFEGDYKVLLLDRDQTKLKDGIYVEIWQDMRACNETIYEGEDYVVLKWREQQ